METAMHAFDEANDVLVGGVNSPVRAYGSVGGQPSLSHRVKARKSPVSMGHLTLTTSYRMVHY